MDEKDRAILMSVFSSVFEEFAFMFAEESEDGEPETGNPCPCVSAEINFSGKDKDGFLEIAAPKDVCDELAENLLGAEDEELPEEAGENALTELLNVACGYFLAEKFGTDEVFDLSIPGTRNLPDSEWDEMEGGGEFLMILVDESPVMARAEIRQ